MRKKSRRPRRTFPLELLELRQLLSTIYVDAIAPGTNDGSSWANAYTDLQQALSLAADGTTIEVGQGTYKPTAGTDRTISFQLKTGVAIYGGYAGYGTANPDIRDVSATPTILSGNIASASSSSDNSYHVLNLSSTAPVLLDGLTITGGNANPANSFGGGIYVYSGDVTMNDCNVTSNSASAYGGGLYAQPSSTIIVTNSTFSGNAAGLWGGAICGGSNITVSNSTFIRNSSGDQGGAMEISGPATIQSCLFEGNTSKGEGGAISDDGSSTITNCLFSGNAAYSYGGAIHTSGAPTLTNCTIVSNTISPDYGLNSTGDGGAFESNDPSAPATLINCIVWNNSGGNLAITGTFPNVSHSDLQSTVYFPDPTNLNADPRLIATPSAGSDGIWGTADDDYGDLRLQLISPCVDTGSNAAIPTGVTTDLAGNPRVYNQTVDMGAFEHQGPVYVDQNAVGANDGSSWANAYTGLAAALVAAVPGQDLFVAQGTYKPTAGTDQTVAFQLMNGIGLYGGYAGVTGSNPNARNPYAYATILSGDLGTPGNYSDNSYHVLTTTNTESSAILDGFTIMDGYAAGASLDDSGGGMLIVTASPTIANCTFIGNAAASGGAIFLGGGSPSLTDCVFSGNSGGDAIHMVSSTPTFVNCTFGADSTGPTLYCLQSRPSLTNCILGPNSSVDNLNSTITVNDSDFETSLAGGGHVAGGQNNLQVDPEFIRPSSPGPDGKWRTSDDDFGDLRLQSTSPCIDAGSNAAVPNGVVTDIAGNSRFVDTPGVHDPGAIVDMGAYEFGTPIGITAAALTPGQLSLAFSADVSASVNLQTLQLVPLGSNTPIAPAGVAYNSSTNTANFDLTNLPPGIYTATIDPTAIADSNGDFLSSGYAAHVLLVGNNQSFALPGVNQTIIINQLALGTNASVDLGSDTLEFQYAAGQDPQSQIASLIASAYANNQWTGPGFSSSLLTPASKPVSAVGSYDDGSEIKIRATWIGDANCDGTIDADDLSLMLLGQKQHATDWSSGNFNYDTKVDADDWLTFALAAGYSANRNFNDVFSASALGDASLETNSLLAPTSGGILQ